MRDARFSGRRQSCWETESFWRCYAVPSGKQVPKFRKNIVPSPSGLRSPDEGTTIPPNVRNTYQSRQLNIQKAKIFYADRPDETNSRFRNFANTTKNGYYIFRYENYYTDQLLLTTSISSNVYFTRAVLFVSYVVTKYPTMTPFLTVPYRQWFDVQCMSFNEVYKDWQCMYNATLQHVRLTTVAIEAQQCGVCIVEIYVTVNNIYILTVTQKWFMENLYYRQTQAERTSSRSSTYFRPIRSLEFLDRIS